MMKPKLLHVTDLYYPSKGRVYYEEDLFLSEQLSSYFDLVLCNPRAAVRFMDEVDLVLFRNTGPVMYFQHEYDAFRANALASGRKVFNELTGKADMQGKQYLVDLARAGYPVIPSVDHPAEFHRLPAADRYLIKLKHGADSIGMDFVSPTGLVGADLRDKLVQPVIDFDYELSFYFINDEFQYALYAPNPDARWKLERYDPTPADLAYAQQFIAWNDIRYGIQRIDACRTGDGQLLLMEIEDINPYLSLDLLPADDRQRFVDRLSAALLDLLDSKEGDE